MYPSLLPRLETQSHSRFWEPRGLRACWDPKWVWYCDSLGQNEKFFSVLAQHLLRKSSKWLAGVFSSALWLSYSLSSLSLENKNWGIHVIWDGRGESGSSSLMLASFFVAQLEGRQIAKLGKAVFNILSIISVRLLPCNWRVVFLRRLQRMPGKRCYFQ